MCEGSPLPFLCCLHVCVRGLGGRGSQHRRISWRQGLGSPPSQSCQSSPAVACLWQLSHTGFRYLRLRAGSDGVLSCLTAAHATLLLLTWQCLCCARIGGVKGQSRSPAGKVPSWLSNRRLVRAQQQRWRMSRVAVQGCASKQDAEATFKHDFGQKEVKAEDVEKEQW